MNWEIIVAVSIAVGGWIINHVLTIRAQNKSFRNQIINSARLDITKAIRDYEDWLLILKSSVDGVRYEIIFQELGLTTNWPEKIRNITNKLCIYKSGTNWICRLEEYELLFAVTRACVLQLINHHNKIQNIIDILIQGLCSEIDEPEALKLRKRALKNAENNLEFVYDQLALMEDLLIYLQNYSLGFITKKRIPEREPKDPSIPRLYIDKQGYLQFEEGAEKN